MYQIPRHFWNLFMTKPYSRQLAVAGWQPAVVGALQLSLLFMSANTFAGAWTLKEGDVYNKIAINYFEANDTFGQGAEGFEEFTDLTLNYYGEFGLTDDLTFIAQVPLRRSENTSFGESTDNAGVGDIDLGLRYNFINSKWVVSGQALYKAPFLYDEDDNLPLGNGQSDLEFRLQLGRSLYPYGYLGIEAGYRVRFEEPSDEFRYLVEYGFDISEKVYLRTKLDAIIAIDSTDIDLGTDGNPNFPNAFDLTRVEASAGYKINPKSAIEFTYTKSLSGENSLDGDTFQLGYVFQLGR